MADKKEIVLQKCKNAIDCGEPITDYGFYYEVIALLKEQEPIEPKIRHGNWWFQCGKCKAIIEYGDKFCKECGQEAKWK